MINKLGPPREGKKLLVLDIDNTLGDLCTDVFNFITHARPHLHEFLARAYKYYDIALWSAVNMGSITIKLEQLQLMDAGRFHFICTLDKNEMIAKKVGIIEYRTKCLDRIWSEYPQYNQTNTIICDDRRSNFIANLGNGIEIRPYYYVHYLTDDELVQLAAYVEFLARTCEDFSQKDHSLWHDFVAT